MATIYKRKQRKPIPDNARFEERRGERIAIWTDSTGRHRARLAKDGKAILVDLDGYEIQYFDEAGKRRKELVRCGDKDTAKQIAAEREKAVLLRTKGLVDPRAEKLAQEGRRPLKDHLDDFERFLTDKGNTAKHVGEMLGRVRRIIGLCGATVASDLMGPAVMRAVGELRDKGASTRTANAYLNAIKSLSRWMYRHKRMADDPLCGLERFNEKTDRRHVRRELSGDEVAWLLATTEVRTEPNHNLTGPDRAMVYRLALGTGFRARELRSLTPESFDLDATPPAVIVAAAYSKHRREDRQPIRKDLADLIRPWLAGRAAGDRVFGRLPDGTARMLRGDLAAARQAWLDAAGSKEERAKRTRSDFLLFENAAGEVADFHSTRHTYISGIVAGGASVKTAQELARHCDPSLTIGRYSHVRLHDLEGALEALPAIEPMPLPAKAEQQAALRGTGTDDRPPVKLPAVEPSDVGESWGQIWGQLGGGGWQELAKEPRLSGGANATNPESPESILAQPQVQSRARNRKSRRALATPGLKAEGKGFVLPVFRNFLLSQRLASKSFSSRTLVQSGYSLSFPVVAGCGGRGPGQILDKFTGRFSRRVPRNPGTSWPPAPVLWGGWRTSHRVRFRRGRPKGRGDEGPTEPPPPDDGDGADPEDDPAAGDDPAEPQGLDAPLPRSQRKRRRARADRGLPPDDDLVALATAYLERQRRLWPKLVEAGVLPEPTESIVQAMVADFKHRHRTGEVALEQVQPFVRVALKLGADYNRFSCDNSSATSIIDQMIRALDKSHGEGRFIPWAYVFCDYSISGLDASRQGYTSLKAVISDPQHPVETVFIDDFSRAGRDEIEWWRLAALAKRCKKRLIGASDGFDLSNPNSDLLITMFGLVSRLFIKGLREKVRRGMRGAASRGTVLGRVPLGFTRKVHRDKNGNVVFRPDGRPRHEPCIDPETQKHRYLIAELFSVKKWSPFQIAKHCNDIKLDGWDGWTESGIKKYLVGLDAMGIFIWNRTHHEYDPEQDRIVTVKNPRSEWECYINRELRLIPVEWWVDARRRLRRVWDKRPSQGPKPSRNQISATTLFSGTLFCEYCGEELTLVRSAGKYQQMACLNGINHAHGCKLSSSKSVKIIEECLLNFIRTNLFTEKVVEGLLANANAFFKQEAEKPRVDTAPLKAEARKLTANIRRYHTFMEEEPDDMLCRSHNARVKELQGQLNVVQAKIREADHQNRTPPKPLDLNRSRVYVPDLRGLLNEEIPMAAESLRTLTGPITIGQEKYPGKRGARWVAKFRPDVLALLRKVAQESKYPDAASLAAAVPEPPVVEVTIEKVPKYEELASKFKQLVDNGASIESVAHAHGMSRPYALEILEFARTGKRPTWGSVKQRGTGKAKTAKYPDIQARVVHMRDVENKSFEKIAAALGVGKQTVTRAYDEAHPEIVREAAETGHKPQRGRYSHLPASVFQEIRRLISEGVKPKEIAKQLGCGLSTVNRERRAMKEEADGEQAA